MAQPPYHAMRTDGWIYFAGLLLMLAGIFHALTGLVALYKDEVYLVGAQSLLILDYTGWGWMHLILGIVLIVISVTLRRGTLFGRTAAVVAATLSAIANFTFIGAFPLWSLLIIALDVLVIYALLVHSTDPYSPTSGPKPPEPPAKKR